MAGRTHPGLTEPLERPLLAWLAARLPPAVGPDALTLLGLAGAFVSFLGYLLARQQPHFLWLASAGLALNWLGDSLDGTLARHRGTERPRYGFLVDHTADLFSQLLVGLGLTLCGFVRPEAALLALIVYLMAVAAIMIARSVTGEMTQSLEGIGPTEVRLVLVGLNLWFWLRPPRPILALFGIPLSWLDMAIFVLSLAGVSAIALRSLSEARRLRQSEPP
jgi:phosphatidylglycerophosphate synthase